jgi:hypothetical protein
MSTFHRIVAGLGATAAAAVLTTTLAPAAEATASSAPCPKVVTIAARGTTQGNDKSLGALAKLSSAIQSKTKLSDRVYNLPYQSTTTGFAGAGYNGDVSGGEKLLRSYLTSTASTCGAGTSFVLVGWSKGANVVMDTIDDAGTQLSATVRGRIKAVVVYGDPTFDADQPFDRGTYNWLAPSLFPRQAGFTKFGTSRIRSYCDDGDAVCQSNLVFGWDVHSGYFAKYDGTASSFVVGKLGS